MSSNQVAANLPDGTPVTFAGERSLGRSVVSFESDGTLARIVGSRCEQCGDTRFPPRTLCPNDLSEVSEVLLSRAGTVYEAVQVHLPPPGYASGYWVGYVDLDRGPRVFARIEVTNDTLPSHGQRVTVDTIQLNRDGDVVVVPTFRGDPRC